MSRGAYRNLAHRNSGSPIGFAWRAVFAKLMPSSVPEQPPIFVFCALLRSLGRVKGGSPHSLHTRGEICSPLKSRRGESERMLRRPRSDVSKWPLVKRLATKRAITRGGLEPGMGFRGMRMLMLCRNRELGLHAYKSLLILFARIPLSTSPSESCLPPQPVLRYKYLNIFNTTASAVSFRSQHKSNQFIQTSSNTPSSITPQLS
ncbi:hypothetical protein BU26DRAFT_330643 [Trematosphaeria pertusa]|uniref:Uncharacterized protein n=1 Tax=Trematosphaeria pertusa TaxID=390896 RepID=A0A6A6IDI5_9PLEO|nr:uncharacterized protein BU26DRAFT_330643 [Trematosphaeria pertusa]KAF2248279.1 hypothetical protein BU26DRAFT_330643 [Trematosphaeria pertusa]